MGLQTFYCFFYITIVQKSEILVSFHPEMALFRNLCACPVKCAAYFSGVNLRNYLFPPQGGTQCSLITLTLRKIAHFCIGNLNCAQYIFLDGHELMLISMAK
jgi:hypothetical protein